MSLRIPKRYPAEDGLIAIPLLCGSLLIVILITLVILLGMFAYRNPDPPDCWYIDGLSKTYLTEIESVKAADAK